MQLWLCCALLVVAAGGCSAQRPRPCKSPPLLEGSLTVGSQGGFSVYAKYAYDAILQRIRITEFGQYANKTFYEDVLLLYQEHAMYLINHKNKTCQKRKLTSQFHPMKIPCNATFLAQVVLGSLSLPGQGLLVKSWAGEAPEGQGQYVMTFTEFGCLPVNVLFNRPNNGWVVINFFNIVRGIINPAVFIPPPYCSNATVETEEEGDFFSVFI